MKLEDWVVEDYPYYNCEYCKSYPGPYATWRNDSSTHLHPEIQWVCDNCLLELHPGDQTKLAVITRKLEA